MDIRFISLSKNCILLSDERLRSFGSAADDWAGTRLWKA